MYRHPSQQRLWAVCRACLSFCNDETSRTQDEKNSMFCWLDEKFNHLCELTAYFCALRAKRFTVNEMKVNRYFCVIRTEIFGDIKHSFLEFYSIWRKWGVSFYRISESLSFKSHSIMANYFWNWSIGTWKEWRKIMLVLMKDKLTNWWFFHLNWFCMILIPVSSTPLAIIEC